ncbi:MAG: hypothetical protein EAX86_03545 [Candidatus Heimdallarchaeota archaeon]|nr:hypothetical protein [Candidatus Heimdallarchaeota archaeon]
MSDEEKLSRIEWHRKMAVQFFNQTWDILDKKERTEDDNNRMIHLTHGSALHWNIVVESGKYSDCGPLNLERGEWQISRVYSVVGNLESALYHAQRCLKICKANKIEDFDIAFAYEAMARVFSLSGNTSETEKYIKLAQEAGTAIKDEKDKEYFFNELSSILV